MIDIIFVAFNYLLTFFIEYISLADISKSDKKINYKSIALIIAISIINYYATFTTLYIVKSFISFLSLYFLALFSIRKSKESAFASLIYFIYMVIIELFTSIILINVLKYNPEKFIVSVSIQKLIVSAIILFILYILCKFKFTNKLYRLINSAFNKIGLKDIHVALLFVLVSLLSTFYVVNVAGETKLFYSIIYILVFILFIVYLFVSLYRNYYLKVFNNFLKDKDDEYQKLIDEYRMFKHNIKHALEAIASVGDKKTKKIISEYMNDYTTYDDNVSNLANMPKGFRGTIYHKIIKSNKLNSKILIDNFLKTDPMDILSLKKYCRLVQSLGIIFDNAIEAIDDSSDSYVYLLFMENNNEYIIKCYNQIANDVSIDTLLEKGKSTKKEHMGVGIHYIKNKTNFDFTTTIKNDMFCATLRIKK